MRVKSFIGYTLAVMSIPLAVGTFIGMDVLSHKLVEVTGIKVSPWSTGGEIVKIIEHDHYRTLLHRPVFDGLFKEETEGFVQIDWEGKTSLPVIIMEEIDYDGDGIPDFSVAYNTQTNVANLTSYHPKVISLRRSYILAQRRAVRVNLYNQ